ALAVTETTPPVVLKLAPGKKLRGRVVDKSGRGVAGARLWCSGWRNTQALSLTLTTRPDGSFSADDCPADPLTFTVFAARHAGKSVQLTAGDDAPAKTTITLGPALRVSGSIVDA